MQRQGEEFYSFPPAGMTRPVRWDLPRGQTTIRSYSKNNPKIKICIE